MICVTIFKRIGIIALVTAICAASSGLVLAESWSNAPEIGMNAGERPQKPPKGSGFEADDANNDGIVTRSEFSGPDDLFKHLDRDGDGHISREEARPPKAHVSEPH